MKGPGAGGALPLISARCLRCGFASLIEPGRPRPCPACAFDPRDQATRAVSASARSTAPGAPPKPRASLAVGAVLLDEFVVEGELGQGGMGVVYLVRSRTTSQPFAAKMARFAERSVQQAFLREIQVWVDLPRDAHLACCRFFRTTADGVIVFADLVDGGSLRDWIRARRLKTLDSILAAAIQFAWGLQVAHDAGVVHQDVKPGNALMTAEGLLKVSDFGLAAARATTGPQGAVPGTAAYRSPEQAKGRTLTVASDVWSWGVSVLEMFAGEVVWSAGEAASEVLQSWADIVEASAQALALPDGVRDILARCFAAEPGARWRRIEDAALALAAVHRREIGRPYRRRHWSGPSSLSEAAPRLSRVTLAGRNWDKPTEWLAALGLAGDPGMSGLQPPASARSLRGAALGDLVVFEEIASRVGDRRAAGHVAPALVLRFRIHKGRAHLVAGDSAGAVREFEAAMEDGRARLARGADAAVRQELACAFLDGAETELWLRQPHRAGWLSEKAITLLDPPTADATDRLSLARALVCCATAQRLRDKASAALGLARRAEGVLEGLRSHEPEPVTELGRARVECARAEEALGRHRDAVSSARRALKTVKGLARAGMTGAIVVLAGAHDCLASALLGVPPGPSLRERAQEAAALPHHDRSLGLLQHLIHDGHRSDLGDALAAGYSHQAATIARLGEKADALLLLDRADALLQDLFVSWGRHELADDIAQLKAIRQRVLYEEWSSKPTPWVVLPHMARALAGWDPRMVVQATRLQRWGWVADFCPVCRDFRVCGVWRRLARRSFRGGLPQSPILVLMTFIGLVSVVPCVLSLVLYLAVGALLLVARLPYVGPFLVPCLLVGVYVLLSRARFGANVIGYRIACRACGAARDDATPADYRTVVRKLPATLGELVLATRPRLVEESSQRLEVEENLSAGALPPQSRRALLEEPFVHLNAALQLRLRSVTPWIPRGFAWGCLSAIVGTFVALSLLQAFYPNRTSPHWLGVLAPVVSPACVVGYWLYRGVQALMRVDRVILPALARSLVPLSPAEAEVETVLAGLRAQGLAIGSRIKARDLVRRMKAVPQMDQEASDVWSTALPGRRAWLG